MPEGVSSANIGNFRKGHRLVILLLTGLHFMGAVPLIQLQHLFHNPSARVCECQQGAKTVKNRGPDEQSSQFIT